MAHKAIVLDSSFNVTSVSLANQLRLAAALTHELRDILSVDNSIRSDTRATTSSHAIAPPHVAPYSPNNYSPTIDQTQRVALQ
jgi:hypothetical protein